ncbi:MAG: hypothetical protein LBT00_04570 [Spirochaetaceae bacterium]|nr:hypothetical protein [Spirochaetaceae bacterium]
MSLRTRSNTVAVGEAIQPRGVLPGLLRPAMCRSLAMTGEPLSLRGGGICRRRSNPAVECLHPGLLRSARNDGRGQVPFNGRIAGRLPRRRARLWAGLGSNKRWGRRALKTSSPLRVVVAA